MNSQLTSNGSNPKFKLTKFPNQKIQPKSNSVLHPDPIHIQRYTKTQNKGMEKDLPTKWRAKINNKKKAGVAILASNKIDFKATKI